MPFLTIASINIPVANNEATKKAPERIGKSMRMFNGSLRTTVRYEKRGWSVTTKLLPESTAASIETAVANGAFVSCSGDMLGGSVTCEVTVADSPYEQTGATVKRRLTLLLKEV